MNINFSQPDIVNILATSDLFQLLSISLRFPDHDLTKAILDGSYGLDTINILEELCCSQGEIAKVGELLKSFSPGEDIDSLLTQMKREYTRLFDNPQNPVIHIYETLFLQDQEKERAALLFMSPISLDVERCYKEAGVSLVEKSAEPADHMATELEFMMYLYARKGQAIQEKNQQKLARLEKQVKQFQEQHLNKWCDKFFEKLEAETELAAYQLIAYIGIIGLGKILKV